MVFLWFFWGVFSTVVASVQWQPLAISCLVFFWGELVPIVPMFSGNPSSNPFANFLRKQFWGGVIFYCPSKWSVYSLDTPQWPFGILRLFSWLWRFQYCFYLRCIYDCFTLTVIHCVIVLIKTNLRLPSPEPFPHYAHCYRRLWTTTPKWWSLFISSRQYIFYLLYFRFGPSSSSYFFHHKKKEAKAGCAVYAPSLHSIIFIRICNFVMKKMPN